MSDEEIENFFDATLDEVLASMPEDWQLLHSPFWEYIRPPRAQAGSEGTVSRHALRHTLRRRCSTSPAWASRLTSRSSPLLSTDPSAPRESSVLASPSVGDALRDVKWGS